MRFPTDLFLAPAGQMAMDFKEGDWHCASCGDHQFARNSSCRKCGAPRDAEAPRATISGRPIMKVAPSAPKKEDTSGDWNCPQCGDYQFGRNAACRKCGAPKPAKITAPAVRNADFKDGDWNCPDCGDHQFARNATCRRCGASRPNTVTAAAIAAPRSFTERRQPIPTMPVTVAPRVMPSAVPEKGFVAGDWHCPACGDHQFARNASCRRCGAEKPAVGVPQVLPRGVQQVIEIDGLHYIPAPIQPTQSLPTQVVRPSNGQEFKAGDWSCPACSDHQFERNATCRKCGTPKPAVPTVSSAGPTIRGPAATLLAEIQSRHADRKAGSDFKPGDWVCPGCGDHQFQRNEHCRKCGTARPPAGDQPVTSSNNLPMKPGDWLCPACGDMQFARNEHCRRCGANRPEGEVARSRSPRR
eukprot:s1693_g5.t1